MTGAPSWWWERLGGLPAPRPACGRPRRRRVHRRRGLHRPVDGLRAAARRPGLESWSLEREVAGLRRLRAQRRLGAGRALGRGRPAPRGGTRRDLRPPARGEEAVDEVGAACAREDIACDFLKGGTLTVAQTAPQWERLQAFGRGELLDAEQAAARVRSRACAARASCRVRARTARRAGRGLAAAAERHGATIHEGTAVSRSLPARVRTRDATVRARWVVRATEGYTQSLRGARRALLPLPAR